MGSLYDLSPLPIWMRVRSLFPWGTAPNDTTCIRCDNIERGNTNILHLACCISTQHRHRHFLYIHRDAHHATLLGTFVPYTVRLHFGYHTPRISSSLRTCVQFTHTLCRLYSIIFLWSIDSECCPGVFNETQRLGPYIWLPWTDYMRILSQF